MKIYFVEVEPSERELRSKTFGIIGAGRIGLRTVPIARNFGMNVIAYDIRPRPELAGELGFRYVSFEELLAGSDIISLHASLNPSSYHILNRDAFAKCRPGVVIIRARTSRALPYRRRSRRTLSGSISPSLRLGV